jgi:hypothetical protein
MLDYPFPDAKAAPGYRRLVDVARAACAIVSLRPRAARESRLERRRAVSEGEKAIGCA